MSGATSHSRTTKRGPLAALALSVWLCAAAASQAQLLEQIPEEMQGVGIDDKSGEEIPLDLRFRDENGKAITLADVFSGERPVLLSLNYSDCPMLCTLQLTELVRNLREMEWSAGMEFDVVSVSVDPLETTARAKQTEQKYLKQYNRPGAADGFRFLTGNNENIRALADAVGFRYKYVPRTGEFSHTAAEIVCSPEGMVSRYLYGVGYDPQTIRLSLVEAADGRVGSTLDQIILFCFHYDETEGRYGPVARKVMSLGAGVTVFALALGLVPFWLRRAPTGVAQPSADSEEPQQAAEPEPAVPASTNAT